MYVKTLCIILCLKNVNIAPKVCEIGSKQVKESHNNMSMSIINDDEVPSVAWLNYCCIQFIYLINFEKNIYLFI